MLNVCTVQVMIVYNGYVECSVELLQMSVFIAYPVIHALEIMYEIDLCYTSIQRLYALAMFGCFIRHVFMLMISL